MKIKIKFEKISNEIILGAPTVYWHENSKRKKIIYHKKCPGIKIKKERSRECLNI